MFPITTDVNLLQIANASFPIVSKLLPKVIFVKLQQALKALSSISSKESPKIIPVKFVQFSNADSLIDVRPVVADKSNITLTLLLTLKAVRMAEIVSSLISPVTFTVYGSSDAGKFVIISVTLAAVAFCIHTA